MSEQFAPGGPDDTRNHLWLGEFGEEFVLDDKSFRIVLRGDTQLSKDEAFSLAAFIDSNLIDYIRDNPDIDNMGWFRNMIHAYEKLCTYSGYVGWTEPKEEDDETDIAKPDAGRTL